MWAQDSFWTLGGPERAGLVAVALLTAAVAAGLLWPVLRRPWPLRVAAALAVTWLYLWLSPQGFYAYYRAIFDGLPAQWVAGPPPGPLRLVRALTFTEEASLSRLAQGLLGWALLALALRGRR
ncbi:hypothetical protein JQC91_03845 [Jannaschia sp. Os4]|uniref:hypothetical protein n=1 Tax=Jannaschia sp. Os4 TaxID=2807617 RepID=UPI0019393186|nr:hypothetical protein [Jannaschia sp. Os4]MBM2575427.1 hypothetical protein [Jannaschia sp. Os4]